jgi:hypothetical protein
MCVERQDQQDRLSLMSDTRLLVAVEQAIFELPRHLSVDLICCSANFEEYWQVLFCDGLVKTVGGSKVNDMGNSVAYYFFPASVPVYVFTTEESDEGSTA